MGCNSTDVGVAGEKRTNAQVWEEMRRLQRLGTEAIDTEAIDAATAEALRQAQMSPFEGLPDKVRRIAYLWYKSCFFDYEVERFNQAGPRLAYKVRVARHF